MLTAIMFAFRGATAAAALPMSGTFVPQLAAVDQLLQNFMAGTPIPGGNVAITHGGRVIYERGIGYSGDFPAAGIMPENALMRLASVTKPITASAIHQLAKDGIRIVRPMALPQPCR